LKSRMDAWFVLQPAKVFLRVVYFLVRSIRRFRNRFDG
jgi:hypothetical protein